MNEITHLKGFQTFDDVLWEVTENDGNIILLELQLFKGETKHMEVTGWVRVLKSAKLA